MDPLAIYIHWPYCARICPYCDFNVYKRREDNDLLPAILADLKYWRDLSGPGGTPSLMTPRQVGEICEKIDDLWGLSEIEIALEANPHEMDAEDWRGYRAAGLNRLSLGIQTFNDKALKFLGRDHDSETARAADMSADLYDDLRGTLTSSGFNHYEVSNFAKARHQSKHNLAYWRGWDYVGVGPGAHGRITIDNQRQATVAHMRPKAYADAVKQTGYGLESRETLSPEDRAAEYLLMGLRIDEGISLEAFAQMAGRHLNKNEVRHMIDDGLLSIDKDKLSATSEGRLVLNAVTERLLLTQ